MIDGVVPLLAQESLRSASAVGGVVALGALAWAIRRKDRARNGSSTGGGPVYGYRGGANPDADPWLQLDPGRIDRLVDWFERQEGVKGQTEALRILRDELYLARAGLSGAASGIATKPRIALFFAGPTGVGKTLTAQKLAKFVFGDEGRFLRLDMTEYKEEHTVHKLVGAPPSYVGFDRGGVLTNAIRKEPFQVVLVDEIEKAHPKVLDLFLQILDHGGLTDGKGQSVAFRDTAILFTSNLGVRTQDAQGKPAGERAELESILKTSDLAPELRRERVRTHFRRAVARYFTHEISRPELLNRIGDSIVPFNFIDAAEVQKDVVRAILDRLKQHVEREWERSGFRVEFGAGIPEFIVGKESASINEFGARWITHALRQELLRQLAPALLNARQQGRAHLTFRLTPSRDGRLGIEEIPR